MLQTYIESATALSDMCFCSQMSLQLGMTSTNYLCIASLEYRINSLECESLYRDLCEWQAKLGEITRTAEVSL